MEKGYSITQATKEAGFSKGTYFLWKRSDKPEDKEFIKRCEVQQEYRTDIVEDALFVNATKKQNVIAQIFWLKNRRRDKWRDKIDNIEESQTVNRVEVIIKRAEVKKPKKKGEK